MAKIFMTILVLLTFISCKQNSTQKADREINPTDDVYEVVWSDEFDYEGKPDSTKWTYDLGDACDLPAGCGWGNNELEYYTNDSKNVRVESGNLIIEAIKEPIHNSQYSSARIKTKGLGDWTYGRFSIRAKLPKGVGTWPAIWLLPTVDSYGGWPKSGEIDLMEHVGYDSLTIHGTVHTETYNHLKDTQKSGTIQIEDAEEEFHVYSIVWKEDYIDWYVDDQKYFTFSKSPDDTSNEWPFDQPYHLIMNLAVGGGWGGRQGVDESIWPQKMVVDYVRVEQ